MASKGVGKASLRAALKARKLPETIDRKIWQKLGKHQRKNKFNAKKHVVDGMTFDSGKERDRYLELQQLTKAGLVSSLVCHQPFEFLVNEVRIGKFTPDFCYFEYPYPTAGMRVAVVEDTKGGKATKTEAYRLRVRLFKALYPQYTFRET